MAKYRCMICGEIYDEEVEGVKFEDLPDDWVCPVCRSPKSEFVLMEEDDCPKSPVKVEKPAEKTEDSIELDPKLVRHDNGIIDERADGDGKTAENHGVDGVVEEVQNDNSHNHR